MTALLSRSVHAQNGDPRTFRACFVPTVGALYMIGEKGLPDACLSETHEEMQWTEDRNGTVTILDGSVTTPKLATDAVTSEKIVAEAVGSSEIARGAVQTHHVADEAITVTKIADGAVGGEQLAAGAVASEHLDVSWLRTFSSASVPAGSTAVIIESCTDGREPIAGAWETFGDINVVGQGPSGEKGWRFRIRNNDAEAAVVVALALICVDLDLGS
jgi:hypothetical protein